MSRPYALLITSLGNPPPLHTTRHSAGHILLKSLALHLHAPPFTRSKPHASGQLTHSHSYNLTLWQSPTSMNVSGPAFLSAWKAFVKENQARVPLNNKDLLQEGKTTESVAAVALGLVILHDDLESPPSTLKIRRGLSGSLKGHNGLKSVLASFKGAGLSQQIEGRVVRVGVGIGRPSTGGRGRGEVSDYVLGKVTVPEKEGIEGLVVELVEVLGKEGEWIAGHS